MKEYTIKPEDLAKRFNVSTKTIHNWYKKGIIPGVKIGQVIRFNQDEIEKYVEVKK